MRIVENKSYSARRVAVARLSRLLRDRVQRTAQLILNVWNAAFPMPLVPTDPNDPPTIAKAAALREGAKLSESLDAVSDKRVA